MIFARARWGKAPRALLLVALLGVFAGSGCGERSTSTPSSTATSGDDTTAAASGSGSAGAAGSGSAAAPVASTPPEPPPDADAPPRAIDMHVDTPWQVKFKKRSIQLKKGHATMSALKKGKYGGIFYPIYIADHLHGNNPTIQDADDIYDTIDAIVKEHSDVLVAYPNPAPPDKVTAYVSIEGAGAFAKDITQIDRFIKRGVLMIGPVHWHDSPLSTSATGDKKDALGLTDVGKKFCERVYENGALVDVSHMSDRGFADLVPIAAKYGAPIVATHSNARAVANHPRNLSDDQLRIIAKTGGVAGLNFYGKYVNVDGKPKIADLVKHAKHMIEVAGIDHVGIGSDFDGGDPADGLENAGKIQALAKALRKAGLSAEDVHKIFSENVKRVIRWTKDRRKP